MTSIKQFSSTDPAAPVLSGTAGALAAILKAYLVDGRGASAVQGINVAAGMATATYASAHPFAVGSIALFAGATAAALNGEQRIVTRTANSVTFSAPGVVDGSATGSITSKLAPAGWQQLFAGASPANVLCIKSGDVAATGNALRIDDTGQLSARLVGYEAMTDASTGVGPFPTAELQSGGQYWHKSNAAGGDARPWRLISDGRTLYLWVSMHSSGQDRGQLLSFGDLLASKAADAWATVLGGMEPSINTSVSQEGCAGYGQVAIAARSVFVIARSYTGVGGARAAKKVAAFNTTLGYSGSNVYNGDSLVYPNPADNSLRLTPVEVVENGTLRGVLPGVYHCPQRVLGFFATGDLVQGTGLFANDTFMALAVGPQQGGTPGVVFIKLTGSWR